MTTTPGKPQIIYDDSGAPAFAVIPYAQFRRLAGRAEAALSEDRKSVV